MIRYLFKFQGNYGSHYGAEFEVLAEDSKYAMQKIINCNINLKEEDLKLLTMTEIF